jgi:two-component system sensor histidine kinase AgrC
MRFSIHVSVTICLIILLINTIAKSYSIHFAYLGITITLFCAITFFTALSLIIYFKARKKEQDLQLAVEQKHIYEHYLTDLEENYSLLRAFKHDYQNMLLSLELYIEENDLKGLKHYFHELKIQSDLELNTIPDYYKALTAISNKSVKSILLAKITKAKDLGIAVTLEVTKKCSFDSYEYEVIRILGILLDNAIEANSRTNQPMIQIAIITEMNSLEIHIYNSYNQDDPIDINQIFQRNYSTKEKNTGIGLYTVKKIVDSHPNMFIEVEKSSLFMVTLTILI